MYTVIEKAPAKINLHLNVINRRSDGYHNIFSLMAPLDLSDRLILDYYDLGVSKKPADIKIENGGGAYGSILDTIKTGDNLVYKASVRYLEKRGISGTVHFVLEKNIPQGAGLAGGSSDAAAALRVLEKVLGPCDNAIIDETAIETGSDVPFCLKGGAAYVEMKGERIIPVVKGIEGYVILVSDGTEINTGYAYSLLGRGGELPEGDFFLKKRHEIDSVLAHGLGKWRGVFINDFESVVFKEYPALAEIKNELYKAGADFAAMSGSGSTVFGVFSSKKSGDAAFKIMNRGDKRCLFSKIACHGN